MYKDIILTVNTTDLSEMDDEYLAEQAEYLHNELLEIEVEDVRQANIKDVSDGAKSLGSIDWGTLVVTLANVGGGVSAFLNLIGSWVQRNQDIEINMILPNGVSLVIKGNIANREDFEGFIDLVQRALEEEADPEGSIFAQANMITLREKMISFLSADEIKTVCFDLGIDYENFENVGKSSLVRELLKYAQRRKIVAQIRGRCIEINPAIDWLK